MAGPRRQRKRARRAARRLLRAARATAAEAADQARLLVLGAGRFASPAAQRAFDALRDRRLLADLARLRRWLAERPEPRLAITCAGRGDGAGGQALSVMSALAFARNHRCRYLHRPFRSVEHAPGDAASWARRWEEFLGLGRGEAPVPADAAIVPIRRFVRRVEGDPEFAPPPGLVVVAPAFRYAEMAGSETQRWLRPLLRARYHEGGGKSRLLLPRRAGAIQVAIHLRRGDVGPDDPRFAPDAPMLATIGALRATLAAAGREADFTLFSEGAPAAFAPYAAAGCALQIGGDPFVAFHNLVASDLLVATDSAFSRAAAMIAAGIVLAPDERWGGGEGWLVRAPDGGFDRAALAALLARRRPAAARAGAVGE